MICFSNRCPCEYTLTIQPDVRHWTPFPVDGIEICSLFLLIVKIHLLDNETLYLILHLPNLGRELRCVVGRNRGGNDRSAHTTSTSKSRLGWNIDICNIFIFAQEGKVEEDS
jgi:hypothetical protein